MEKIANPPFSSIVSPKDCRIISQITSSLTSVGIPLDIINMILSFYYADEKVNTIYYTFSEGCGSGHNYAKMKINADNVYIEYRSGWMGGKTNNMIFSFQGKYMHIDGTNGCNYGVIHINKIIITTTDDQKKKEKNVDFFFDCYQFYFTLQTEWGADLPIALYAGGGCSSNEFNNAHIILNRMCYQGERKDIGKIFDFSNQVK